MDSNRNGDDLMNDKPFDKMTDDELIAYTHRAASDLSYHNAAEGEQYFKEAPQADEARGRYRRGRDAMEERGLVWENRNYLI